MKNTSNDDYIIVGKIGSTYGIQGWLKVYSYTNPVANISEFNPWYIENGENWAPIKVNDIREHGKIIVAKFNGQSNPEEARLLTGKKIAIKRSQLPVLEKNEYYWSDLEGLTVIDQNGKTLGKVAYLIATGSNDVLVVKGTKEHALPYIQGDVIKKIDLEARVMHVDWEEI